MKIEVQLRVSRVIARAAAAFGVLGFLPNAAVSCSDFKTQAGAGGDGGGVTSSVATGGTGGASTSDGGSGGSLSGECGNGIIEPPEACDDGNGNNDDGCSATCEAEWTCVQPGEVTLTQDGEVYKGSISGSTAGGEDQVGLADCGTTMKQVGAATDRMVSFTTSVSGVDAFITLSSGFDGLLRGGDQGCDRQSLFACANSFSGGDGSEILHLPDLAVGSHHVLVDGVTESDFGDFSLDMYACKSEPTSLFLEELHLGQTDFVLITNGGECPVQLKGMRVLFDDGHPGLVDCLSELPPYLLMPKASVKLSEDAVVGELAALPGLTACTHGVPFNPARGGIAYLCNGECIESNVVDMVAFKGELASGSEPPAAIGALSFDSPLTGITDAGQDSQRYVRVAKLGMSPNFLGSDWALKSRVFFDDFEGDLTAWSTTGAGQAATFSIDIESAVGATSLKLAQGPNNGKSTSVLVSLSSATPRYISFYTRVSAIDVNAGNFELTSSGLKPIMFNYEPTGMGLERENNQRTEVPFLASTWYRIELRHIDWTTRMLDYYVDGVLVKAEVPFFANVPSTEQLELYSSTANSVVWWDNIELWQ